MVGEKSRLALMIWKNVFIVGLFSLTFLGAETAEQAVKSVERTWSKALVTNDVATLERVMSDDLTYGHSSGKTDTKRTYIERIQSGAQKYISFDYDPGLSVRIYGDTALLNAVANVRSMTDGKENSLHMRFLHVYVKKNGHWQLTAHQSARLPE
jgi:uncharacterized protein (TIGR02246 family)